VRRFLGGAFATAERSNMPVVAAAIHGTRDVLPSGGIMIYRHALRFEILEVLDPEGARERSRQADRRGGGRAPGTVNCGVAEPG
jgi:1-acyl-sn-glycerol-3-phosphate acyltransferase